MKNFLLIAFALLPMCAHAAEEKGGGWIGLLIGSQSSHAGGTVSPVTYGATLGLKGESIGFGLSYFTGTNKTTVKGAAIKETSSLASGTLSWFPGGQRVFFIGPTVGSAKLTVGAVTSSGKAITNSTSGLVYGGSGGLNIPIGALSIGIDGGYVAGNLKGTSASIAYYLGSIKIWF